MNAFEQALAAKAEYINAPQRQDEWLAFRDSLQDQAL